MELISYGDSIPEGEYRLHSAFANAINFSRGPLIVSLVPPRAGAGPLNLVVAQLPPGAKKLRSTRFYFYVDENRLRKEPEARYDSSVPENADPDKVLSGLNAFTGMLVRWAPPLSLAFIFEPALEKGFTRTFERHLLASFKKGVAHFRAGDCARGVKALRGLGLGLTPSGDDFISGLLAGYNFAMRGMRFDTAARIERIYFHAGGSNPISDSFLRCSYEGRVNAKVLRLMKALSGGGRAELAAAAKAALASGHTSGADFCSGLVFALTEVLHNRGE